MPKILWMSTYSLHDSSSGTSVACRHMLKCLSASGYEVWACTSFAFATEGGFKQSFPALNETLATDSAASFNFDEDNIHYIYVRTENTDIDKSTLADSQLFYSIFRQTLDLFAPDIVMGCGSSPVMQTCFAEAKYQGYSTVYMVPNSSHGSYLFPNVDLVITDSHASSKLYADRDEINILPVGAFFDLPSIVAPDHQKRFVTMFNPSDYKGVAIFAKLAKMCQKELPNLKLLTVSSLNSFQDIVPHLHEKGDLNAHPYTAQDFPNVYMVDPQWDVRPIYAITSVLVVPSLWFEGWGRAASEAIYNNIPVIAANSGGLKESIAGGGVLIDVPQHCIDDYLSIPTDEEIKPWFNALVILLKENFDRELAAARKRLSQDGTISRLNEALEPLIKQTHIQRFRKFETPQDINCIADKDLVDINF